MSKTNEAKKMTIATTLAVLLGGGGKYSYGVDEGHHVMVCGSIVFFPKKKINRLDYGKIPENVMRPVIDRYRVAEFQPINLEYNDLLASSCPECEDNDKGSACGLCYGTKSPVKNKVELLGSYIKGRKLAYIMGELTGIEVSLTDGDDKLAPSYYFRSAEGVNVVVVRNEVGL